MQKSKLLKLLPLSCVLLAACNTTQHKGPAGSPTAPQWREHESQVQKIAEYQTRGAFAYLSDKQKYMPASFGNRVHLSAIACC